MSEVKAVETLACEASHSGFNSRRTPLMEVAAKWMASGLENRSTAEDVVGVRFLQLPSGNVTQLGRVAGF